MSDRMQDICEGVGSMAIFFAVLAAVALIPSWLEFGRWTEVLTWFASGAVGLGLLGVALIQIGERGRAKGARRG